MNKVLLNYKEDIKKAISKINKYSKYNSKLNKKNLMVINFLLSIIILKFIRPYIISLNKYAFYAIVVGVIITVFIIPIIRCKILHKKYVKNIDKNIDIVYKSLNNLFYEYEDKLVKKSNSLYSNIKINKVLASKYIKSNEIILYELVDNIFKENDVLSEKKIYLNNEEKVKYLNNTINLIEKFQTSDSYKYFKVLSSNNLITQYLPNCDYKNTMANLSQIYNIMDIYFNQRKQLLINAKKPLDLGIEGEETVNKYIEIYEDEIINLPNIRLEVDGKSIENDNILITKKGIFILEVKNIGSKGSYSILVQKDGRWIKEINNTSEVIDFNATEQNDRHIAILQKFINNKLNRSIQQNNYLRAEGLVVIANNKLDIRNESMQKIYRISEIYRYINTFDDMLTYDEMIKIRDIILSERLEPKKYPILDYKLEIKNNIEMFKNLIISSYDEKINLGTIYKYLEDSGYIQCCEWLNKSNILKKFKSSKFSSSLKLPCLSDEYLNQLGLSIDYEIRKIEDISKINIDINKNEPKISRVIPMLLITILTAISLNLFYIPGELTPHNDSLLFKEKYGYVDENGKMRIMYKYDYASEFIDGLAIVNKDSKYGIIDKTGRKIVNIKYENIKILSSDLIGLKKDNKWTIINNKGKIIGSRQYDSVETSEQGLNSISVNGKYGFIDNNGLEVIEPIYDSFVDATDDIFILKKENKYFILDKTGKEVIKNEYQDMRKFCWGYAGVKINNKWGFINEKGELIVSPQFDKIHKDFYYPYPNALVAVVIMDGIYYYVDAYGRLRSV